MEKMRRNGCAIWAGSRVIGYANGLNAKNKGRKKFRIASNLEMNNLVVGSSIN